MRASELLAGTVLDEAGRSLGPVRDVRLDAETYEVVGLVIGGGRLARMAHAWGYAEGRAVGPWPFRRLTQRASRRARLIPAEKVVEWGPRIVRIRGSMDDLPRLWGDGDAD